MNFIKDSRFSLENTDFFFFDIMGFSDFEKRGIQEIWYLRKIILIYTFVEKYEPKVWKERSKHREK